jgi:transcription elongation factor Elf1
VNTSTSYPQPGARRRLHRHARQEFDRRLFCGTNGCASRLDLDPASGVARCRICGFTRRIAVASH